MISMHRQIMRRQLTAAGAGYEIDHRNHDGLDNRRKNLRVSTRGQNNHNRQNIIRSSGTSRFKGVCWSSSVGRWRATIKIGDKQHHLGHYTSQIDAAHVYDNAARKHFGDFACTNFTKKRDVKMRTRANLPSSKHVGIRACFGKKPNFGRIRWQVIGNKTYFDNESDAAKAAAFDMRRSQNLKQALLAWVYIRTPAGYTRRCSVHPFTSPRGRPQFHVSSRRKKLLFTGTVPEILAWLASRPIDKSPAV